MARFNRPGARTAVASAVKSEQVPTGRTHQGAPGHARDAKSELFLAAVSTMAGERTFYESADARGSRLGHLVGEVALADVDWLAGFLPWLRTTANLRSVSIQLALEAVHARLTWKAHGGNRRLVDAVLQRADEPGEALAYWHAHFGRALPQPVKRGIADAARRLYTQYSLLKYDTPRHGFRFADVIDLTHPTPDAARSWQGPLFAHALDRRRNRPSSPAQLRDEFGLPVIAANAELRAAAADDPGVLLDTDALREAGMTWEDALSLAGPRVDKARLWEALIPTMGLMALTRNLRGFDEAGVSDTAAAAVAARLADPEQVARSRMLPFRFLAAYRAAPSLRWSWPLEQALTHSLASVPALGGRTLILVDRSGSMFGTLSDKSGLSYADTAAIFGTALALRAESADLVEFGTRSNRVPFSRGESVLKVVERFGNLGGTNTTEAVHAHYRSHDRVIIVTDEQAHPSYAGAPTAQVPADRPVYTWNLAGYRYGHGPSGAGNRHVFGGLADAAFALIPLIEARRGDVGWPWE